MLALAIATALSTSPHSFPANILQEQGWTIKDIHTMPDPIHIWNRSSLAAQKITDSAVQLSNLVVVQPKTGRWTKLRDMGIWKSIAPLKGDPRLPSGLPSGIDWEIYPDPADRLNLGILGNSIYVEATIEAAFRHSSGRNLEPMDLSSESKLFCERLARLTLAGFVGENLTAEGIGAVAGRATAAARSPKTKEAFAILSEWVKPTDWKVSESEDGLSLILARGQDALKAPIGAFGMFVNEEWKPATDTMALRDGQWWAPESALKIIAELG